MAFIYFFLSGLVVLASAIYLYCQYAFCYWRNRGVTYLEPEFPYGNIRRLVKKQENFGLNMADQYRQLRRKTADYGGFYMFAKPMLLVMDPELIKTVLIKEFNKFPDRGIYFNEIHDPLSANMFALKGDKWKLLRSKISPIFSSGKMKVMFQTLVTIGKKLEVVLENEATQGEIEAKDLLARFTTDIIGSCVFGIECNSLDDPNTEFMKYGEQIVSSTLSDTTKIVSGFVVPRLMKFFNMTVTDKESGDFFVNVLKKNMEYRERNKIRKHDFMDQFIRLKHNENIQDEKLENSKFTRQGAGDGATFDELSAQALVFFIAGYDGSSTASSACLFELAQNVFVQDKLRDEIRVVLKKHNGELTYEAISEMKYLDQVVCETLRKYPVAPNLVRVCREDCKLGPGSLVVQKDIMVWISVLGLHMDPHNYPEPDTFDPERFSDEQKVKRHAFTYLPFGEGPRTCLGMRFALLQTKVALVSLLKKHAFSLGAGTQVPLRWRTRGILLFPRDEICLQATNVC